MSKRISRSDDYLRSLSNICSGIGLAFFAAIPVIIFDYFRVGESFLLFPWRIHAVFCFGCLIAFVLFTLFSVVLLWVSYQKANGNHLISNFKNVIFDKYMKPKLLELEKRRFISYLENDDYEKNRIGIYAVDSLRDPNLKEQTQALILRLQNQPDPDNLCAIGKRALEVMCSN